MKIVFLQDDFPPQSFGGAGISTFELALGMKNLGHDVSVITTCREESEAGESDYHGLKIFKIASDYPERWRAYISLRNYKVVKQVEQILKEVRPDVVHANNIHQHLSYASLKVAKKYSKGVVLTARDTMLFSYGKLSTKRYLDKLNPRISWLDNFKQAGKRWNPFRNLFINYYLQYVDKVFAISSSLKEALEKNNINNVEVIYNGIDINEWIVSDDKTKEFKEKHKLENKKIFFFNGRLSPLKGSDLVIKALKAVARQVPEATLLIAGVGEKIRDDNVIFTGWMEREEIKVAYAVADVVLMPSVYLDAFGRVNIEAMVSRKPVVGTCYGGTPEIVEDGVTGYIVNPLYPEQIAEKVLDLLKDPEKAKRFGQSGYERVKSRFNLEDRIKEYILVYKVILDSNL